MFSALGFSAEQNTAYSVLCFIISAGLFQYKYGIKEISNHVIFSEEKTILIINFLTGNFISNFLTRKMIL